MARRGRARGEPTLDRRGGLGRGLGEIIGASSPGDGVSALTGSPGGNGGDGEGADDVEAAVRAGLDALRVAMHLDLCAYLHESDGAGRRLFLQAPSLGALDSTQAFDLLTAMGRLLDAAVEGATEIGAYDGVAVVTRGEGSRGLFALGRRGTGLGIDEQAGAFLLARALGASWSSIDDGGADAGGRRAARVLVDAGDAGVRAEVRVAGRISEWRGEATASRPLEAVAAATLAAIGSQLGVREVAERYVGGTEVVVVVLDDGAGGRSAGAAPRDPDILRATADATLAAAAGPTAPGDRA